MPAIVLMTQVFPPAVGGSGALLENVYSRVRSTEVTVLTDSATCPGTENRRGSLRIQRVPLNGSHWGILATDAIKQHVRLARLIRLNCTGRRTIVHCGRAQPEAVPPYLAQQLPGAPKYLFWAHGEDITTAQTSRDFTFVMKHVYRRASAAIANSRNTARLLESAGMHADRVHVIYPGVDSARFRPDVDAGEIRRRFSDDLLLLSVGRLQKRKGHDLVLEAMVRLRHRLPTLRYLIVGDGEERGRLQQTAARHGVADRVEFLGEVPAAVLPMYFAACDIFVLPNRVEEHDFEGFGLVFLEAAAAGKPVIGGRSGGVPEAVQAGVTGLLVGGLDADELSAAIGQLATSVVLRERMGHAGRERALHAFTWERAARSLEQVHAAVAAEG